MTQPTCTIIAGPNGAGKTTFGLRNLSALASNQNFVNADLIAAGLSPLAPGRQWRAASRLFLQQVNDYVAEREDFAFETTLSGKGYVRLVKDMKRQGWWVNLYYLWLPSVEVSIARVAERVAHGGHDIAREALLRRYSRSIRNLLDVYAPLCNTTICLDNSGWHSAEIFVQDEHGKVIRNKDAYDLLVKGAEDD